jgi:hypothetical protein
MSLIAKSFREVCFELDLDDNTVFLAMAQHHGTITLPQKIALGRMLVYLKGWNEQVYTHNISELAQFFSVGRHKIRDLLSTYNCYKASLYEDEGLNYMDFFYVKRKRDNVVCGYPIVMMDNKYVYTTGGEIKKLPKSMVHFNRAECEASEGVDLPKTFDNPAGHG